MYNYGKMLGIMKEKNITQQQLAADIGISETTLNKKLKNKSDFKRNEMIKILEIFELPVTAIETIFFTR